MAVTEKCAWALNMLLVSAGWTLMPAGSFTPRVAALEVVLRAREPVATRR